MSDKIADEVVVFKGEDSKWYVRTQDSENNKKILSSEGYENFTYAMRVAEDTGLSVRVERADDEQT